jgi:uroporphyrinogen-III decarboxylase
LEANKLRVQNLHKKFGAKVLKHCCGNITPLLDFFIEIGYDAYQSIQATAGMDICQLKKSHGDKITLWGGVSLEHVISGTPQQVREDVRHAMACAKPGGRFILGTSHSVAVGSNYDNYMTMLDEYYKFCDY